MTFVITQRCCNDASCVPACPVDCIHPAPGEPGYLTTEMLYIDPATCIECAACVPACPVGAIKAEDYLLDQEKPYLQWNADYYATTSGPGADGGPASVEVDARGLRVAVVGSGPAGSYAAAALLERPGVQVDLYERELVPHGLVRFGIAPDHGETKNVVSAFPYGGMRGLRLRLGVEVGSAVSHAELAAHYHAVIYAVGADSDRRLGIPGEDLAGSFSATDFVAWYNGRPSHSDLRLDLSACRRVVVVGNGNVALDIARILTSDPNRLACTDIADHALAELRKSAVEEVVVLGRRGAAHAAFTSAELLALLQLPGVDVVVDPADLVLDADTAAERAAGRLDLAVERKLGLLETAAATRATAGDRASRRITLRFLSSPRALRGIDTVWGVDVVRNSLVRSPDGRLTAVPESEEQFLEAQLVLRSVGYRGSPIDSLPFDLATGTLPNDDGRVGDAAGVRSGVYVTGWIKRGPTGVVGTNKFCAEQTVAALLADWAAGALPTPAAAPEELDALLEARGAPDIGAEAWLRVDALERAAGVPAGRPRVKLVTARELLAAIEA